MPFVEAGYPKAISISHVERAIFFRREQDPDCLAAKLKKGRSTVAWQIAAVDRYSASLDAYNPSGSGAQRRADKCLPRRWGLTSRPGGWLLHPSTPAAGSMAADDLASYWQRAGKLLGFVVESPYLVSLSSGSPFIVPAHLPNFGAVRGMLLSSEYDHFAAHASALAAAGYGFSVLEASANGVVAQDVIELLKDWGWSGSCSCAPTWLSET